MRRAELHSATTLPLFPLRTVLMPGGALGLRIFETRYLDLVRDCARNATGFGVCLLLDGEEVGAPATPADFGTEARIEDFDSTPDGLLALRVRGTRLFRIASTRTQANGLVVGEVAWCDPDLDDELRPEHALLGIVLQRILDQVGGEHADAPKARFEEAAWVSWRLAEVLPLTDAQRAALLAIDDPHARLQRL
ncbi:MAG: LON peptidase substrate-binding domain-containing protein, partial [Lysobacter sp.]|nr:LON peptidase substrate-binding domain-containing protein [Lysobacter sp.]